MEYQPAAEYQPPRYSPTRLPQQAACRRRNLGCSPACPGPARCPPIAPQRLPARLQRPPRRLARRGSLSLRCSGVAADGGPVKRVATRGRRRPGGKQWHPGIEARLPPDRCAVLLSRLPRRRPGGHRRRLRHRLRHQHRHRLGAPLRLRLSRHRPAGSASPPDATTHGVNVTSTTPCATASMSARL